MKNVFLIAKEDFKSLFSNTIALIVVICFLFVPSMYAWFNTASSWDPYKATSDLKVAVANNDTGYEGQYLPMEMNIGSEVVSTLHENTNFKWEFTDTQTAIDGVTAGDYYAALVIPKDFSTSLMSFIKTGANPAQVTYYINEKLNPIAPKVTGKGASTIQKSISNEFVEGIADSVLQVCQSGVELLDSDDVARFKTTLVETLSTTSAATSELAGEMRSISGVLGSVQPLLNGLSSVLPTSDSESQKHLQETLSNVNVRIDDLRSDLADLKEQMSGQEGTEEIEKIIEEVDSIAASLKSATKNASDAGYYAGTASDKQVEALASMNTLLNRVCSQLTAAAVSLDEASASLAASQSTLEALSNDDSLNTLRALLQQDSSQLADLLTTPVELNKTSLFPFENNGSSMAAFYISLAIWIGLTLVLSMTKTEVSQERIERMSKARPVKHWQTYLGRYVFFAAISLAQTTFIALGMLFFLNIQCVHPFAFMVTCWIISLAFSLFIYTLVASFGSIGKALAVILLVMQVAGTGGMFPVEMMDTFFQAVYPLLPFSYTITALHACCAGIYQYELISSLACLVGMMVPISLLLGLVLRLPMIKLNRFLVKKIEETGVMG